MKADLNKLPELNKTKFEKLAQQIEMLSKNASKTQEKNKIINHKNDTCLRFEEKYERFAYMK